MKKLILLSILICGCTYNQKQHVMEFSSKEEFPRVRDRWIVEQSLNQPSSEFSLTLNDSELKATGVPLQERMIFAQIDPVNEKIEPQFEFEVEEGGILKVFDKKGTHEEKEVPFVVAEGLVMGKPIIFAIVSKEHYAIATAEFLPYPLEAKGISLQVTHPMLTRFQLQASDFVPGERVALIHDSGSRSEQIVMFADTQGRFSFGLNPTVLGRLGGVAKITVIRESESYSFEYPWGSQLEKKTFQERKQFPIHFSVS